MTQQIVVPEVAAEVISSNSIRSDASATADRRDFVKTDAVTTFVNCKNSSVFCKIIYMTIQSTETAIIYQAKLKPLTIMIIIPSK